MANRQQTDNYFDNDSDHSEFGDQSIAKGVTDTGLFGKNPPFKPENKAADSVQGLADMKRRQEALNEKLAWDDPRNMSRREFLGKAGKAALVAGSAAAAAKVIGPKVNDRLNRDRTFSPYEPTDEQQERMKEGIEGVSEPPTGEKQDETTELTNVPVHEDLQQ